MILELQSLASSTAVVARSPCTHRHIAPYPSGQDADPSQQRIALTRKPTDMRAAGGQDGNQH
jgi:hypothetical protein